MTEGNSFNAADQQNYAVFVKVLPELLRTHAGNFVLMREGRIVQFFSTDDEALVYGQKMFHDGLFSVMEVSQRLPRETPPEASVLDIAAASEAPAAPQPAPTSDYSMRVIVFASQKGGAGKTTLCGQLAVQAEIAGAGPVALIDTDPQGSLAEWWIARAADTPLFAKTPFCQPDRGPQPAARTRDQAGVRRHAAGRHRHHQGGRRP